MIEHSPMFALRGISVRGQDFLPGDEVPDPPTLIERGLATADPIQAAALREISAPAHERRAARERAYETRLAELRDAAAHPASPEATT